MHRHEFKIWLEERGAIVSGHITKDTTMLIVGDERGDVKYNEALRKGVTILPWAMVIYLGFLQGRSWKYLDRDTAQLTGDTLFEMIRIVDNIYAHSFERPELRRSFLCGAEAIDSLLLATGGRGYGENEDGGEDDSAPTRELVSRRLRESISFWKGMIDSIEELK